MLLTILIPTYNRNKDIIYNLGLLEDMILTNALSNHVSIMVSNNASTDNTKNELEKLKIQSKLNLTIFNQTCNLGLERNTLFLLEKASSEYIMFLGDDDYICGDYLKAVISILQNNREISCIIPSFRAITPEKEIIEGAGRDFDLESRIYLKGFNSCKENAFRGHQLSGLTIKRAGLWEEYTKRKVHNIYPFIFFVAYSSLNGDLYHLTDYPIKVTQELQQNKDWNYGKDGLINDIFDNYNKLPISLIKKSELQIRHFIVQPSRLWMYQDKGKKELINAFISIWLAKNSTFIFRFVFPIIVFNQLLKKIF